MTAEQRVIKFRDWADNGVDERTMIYFGLLDVSDGHIEGGYNLNEDGQPVMQFTGLTDKNGKDIYEGDIVYGESPLTSYAENPKYPILWIDALAGFNVSKDRIRVLDLKVIGNIHENPELLEPSLKDDHFWNCLS